MKNQTLYNMEKEVIEAAAVQATPETKAEKSRREKLIERLREKYPEADMEDEEAVFSLIDDDYDSYENTISESRKHEKELADLLASDPRSADFLMNWKKGESPVLLLMRYFGDEFREALDDPEIQEKLVKERNDYIARQTKNAELQAQAQENLAESLDNLDKATTAGGYSEEEAEQAFRLFDQILDDAIVNKISESTWDMVFKAMNYNKDIENAAHDAEVKGRNTKIEEAKMKKNATADLPPNLGSNGGSTPPAPRSFGALDRYTDSDDIWARGAIKRRK